jgi:hypothetical protein
VGKFRKLFVLIAVAGACIGASNQPANAQARWRAYCISIGGTAVSNPGPACFVDGVDVFAK